MKEKQEMRSREGDVTMKVEVREREFGRCVTVSEFRKEPQAKE